jgi:hypothetical protein
MNNLERFYADFVRKYGASVNIESYPESFDQNSFRYYDKRKSKVTIELNLDAFEYMLKCDALADDDLHKLKAEKAIRAEYPAVADAYSKYKMLLELYK